MLYAIIPGLTGASGQVIVRSVTTPQAKTSFDVCGHSLLSTSTQPCKSTKVTGSVNSAASPDRTPPQAQSSFNLDSGTQNGLGPQTVVLILQVLGRVWEPQPSLQPSLPEMQSSGAFGVALPQRNAQDLVHSVQILSIRERDATSRVVRTHGWWRSTDDPERGSIDIYFMPIVGKVTCLHAHDGHDIASLRRRERRSSLLSSHKSPFRSRRCRSVHLRSWPLRQRICSSKYSSRRSSDIAMLTT